MNKKLFSILTIVCTILVFSACSEHEYDYTSLSDKRIVFSTSIDDGWGNATMPTRTIAMLNERTEAIQFVSNGHSEELFLHSHVQPWLFKDQTRGMLMEKSPEIPTDKSFGVYGYRYNTSNGETLATTDNNFITNEEVTENAGLWLSHQDYYWPANNDKLAFFAYYPYNSPDINVSSVSQKGALRFIYTVNTTVESQTDLMTAHIDNQTFNASLDAKVPLLFKHNLTAVRFIVGDNIPLGNIEKITLSGFYTEGEYTVGGNWSLSGHTRNDIVLDYTARGGSGFTISSTGDTLSSGSQTLLMIPQDFTDGDPQIIVQLTTPLGKENRLCSSERYSGMEGWYHCYLCDQCFVAELYIHG